MDVLRLASEGTVRQREAIAIVLASHATQDMAPALLTAHGKATESRVRLFLDRALGRSGAAEATDALIGDLTHPDEGVRIAAVEALGSVGDPRAAAPLAQLLASHEGLASELAAGALAKIGEPVAAFLASTWDAHGPRERKTILVALQRVGGPSVDAFLKERLEDPSPLVALEAALVLAARGDVSGRDLAVERVSSQDPAVAQAARAVLDAIETAP